MQTWPEAKLNHHSWKCFKSKNRLFSVAMKQLEGNMLSSSSVAAALAACACCRIKKHFTTIAFMKSTNWPARHCRRSTASVAAPTTFSMGIQNELHNIFYWACFSALEFQLISSGPTKLCLEATRNSASLLCLAVTQHF